MPPITSLSRSALLGSLLGLGALGVACSSNQQLESAVSSPVEAESEDDSLVNPSRPEMESEDSRADSTTAVIPAEIMVAPVYGGPPMPGPPRAEEPAPPDGSGDTDGSGEADDGAS